VGGGLFVVQLVMQFFGGGSADVDLDTNIDGGTAHADLSHTPTDFSFKILSLQGLTAFLMMFGLVGLAVLRAGVTPKAPVSVGAGLIAGFATTWVIAQLFKLASRMQSSGTLNIAHAVGAAGTVYLTIRKDKPGKVTITVGQRLLTLDGIGQTDETLETGTPIRVVRVVHGDAVIVERDRVDSDDRRSGSEKT
jgi:hypothetical protein